MTAKLGNTPAQLVRYRNVKATILLNQTAKGRIHNVTVSPWHVAAGRTPKSRRDICRQAAGDASRERRYVEERVLVRSRAGAPGLPPAKALDEAHCRIHE